MKYNTTIVILLLLLAQGWPALSESKWQGVSYTVDNRSSRDIQVSLLHPDPHLIGYWTAEESRRICRQDQGEDLSTGKMMMMMNIVKYQHLCRHRRTSML